MISHPRTHKVVVLIAAYVVLACVAVWVDWTNCSRRCLHRKPYGAEIAVHIPRTADRR